jgi:N-acetylglucosamine-6-phosphate deacetylase
MKIGGNILTSRGWFSGEISFNEKIEGIRGKADVKSRFIVPGFIDVHVHGGGGGDTMDGAAGLEAMTAFHARHGTTALLATTITNPWQNVIHALEGIKSFMAQPQKPAARVLGAHLEGPFVSPHKLGAQPPFAVEPTPERVSAVLEPGVVKVVTIAPEQPGALGAIRSFLEASVRVSLGHTAGRAEDAVAVFELAASLRKSLLVSGTHLYNAMSALEGRSPGVVGALLGNPNAYSEIILDGHHVHPQSFRAAFFAKPDKLMLITDAIRAAGLPDGDYDLGGQPVKLQAGVVRLANGSLAGSVLTMLGAVKNAVSAGLALEVALKLASLHPAQYLGLAGYGKLSEGSVADIVVLSESLEIEAVYVGGQRVTG